MKNTNKQKNKTGKECAKEVIKSDIFFILKIQGKIFGIYS